jgi:hypothetical protein
MTKIVKLSPIPKMSSKKMTFHIGFMTDVFLSAILLVVLGAAIRSQNWSFGLILTLLCIPVIMWKTWVWLQIGYCWKYLFE